MAIVTDEGLTPLDSQAGSQRVDETGTNNNIPASFYPIGILVEILVNGIWTDISTYVYQRDDIVITGGRPDEDSSTVPAKMTMTMNNRDGRFSPTYTAGVYYPYLQRNTRIRLTVTAVSVTGNHYSGYRFVGEVAKWPPLADISQNDVYVSIEASGPLRRARSGGGKGSALTRYYSLLKGVYAPISYWPCEEDPNTNIVGAGIDGGTSMTVTFGTPTWKAVSNFNGSAPIGVIDGSTWDGLTGASSNGSGDDLYTSPGTSSWLCPPGLATVDVRCIGGGGGGASGNGTSACGGGGGGAEFAEEASFAVTPGNSYAVVVGAGGAAKKGGGNSTFATTGVVAHGGSGSTTTSGAAGGTGSTNTTHHNGGAGAGQQSSGTQIVKVLTTIGTAVWVAPTGVTSVKVECYAGGGGGSNGGAAASGGGGEYAAEATVGVTPGSSYTYTIGTNGNKGAYSSYSNPNSGTAGGNTQFQGDTLLVLAHGGGGGLATNLGSTAGAGGTGSTNTTHHNGGSGNTGLGANGGSGGGGSAGSTGAGGTGGAPSGNTAGVGGTAGTGGGAVGGVGGTGASGPTATGGSQGGAPGSGGGGGGYDSLDVIDHEGGLGNSGQIILTYTPLVTSGGGGGGSAGTTSVGNTATTAAGATAVTYGGPGGDGGAGGAGNSPQTIPGGGGGGSGGSSAGANGASGKVEVLYTPVGLPNANVIRFIMYSPVHGGNPGKVLLRALCTGSTIAKLEVIYQSGGKLELKGYNSGGTTLFDSGSVVFAADGQTLMVSVELTNSGTSIAWALRAIIPGSKTIYASSTGTVASIQVGNVTEVIVAPNHDITKTAMGHISVQYAFVDLTLVSRALNGHDTEMTTDRFIRLANEQALDNFPFYNETVDHYGFESGTQNWQAFNGAVSQSNAWSSEGGFSLLLTATGEGNPKASSPQGILGTACTPGNIISCSIDIYSTSNLNNVFAGIQFYTAAGVKVGSEIDSTDFVLASVQPTDPMAIPPGPHIPTFYVTSIVPATATFFSVCFGDHENLTSGAKIYGDNVRIQPSMGPQTRKEYHKFLEEIEKMDKAIISESKLDFALRHRTRWTLISQNVVLTLNYLQNQLVGMLAPVMDDKLTKNHIVVHRHKGSKVTITLNSGTMSVLEPPAGVGRYKKELKVIAQRDEQLLYLATLLLALGTNVLERYPTLEVDLSRSEVSSLMSLIASIDIGDYIQVINMPFWYPSPTVKQLVIGYTETINAYKWGIIWNCTPEVPYEISITNVGWW
jgi:hypothetical protein